MLNTIACPQIHAYAEFVNNQYKLSARHIRINVSARKLCIHIKKPLPDLDKGFSFSVLKYDFMMTSR